MIKHGLVVGVLSLYSVCAWSWGSVGHKTSAKIAWSLLDQPTQEKVMQMLGGGDLADASVWPDAARQKPEWKYSMWYHFEKAPDNYTYLDNLKRLDDKDIQRGGLLQALYVAEDVMNNPTSTAEEKAVAIKFMVHCIGDIHQPLHTGRVEDNGGNKVPMKWLDFTTSLHSVWDSQIIYLARKEVLRPNGVDDSTNDSNQNYANFLLHKYKDFKPDASTFARYDDWMHESMVPRTDAYNFRHLSESDYSARFIDAIDMRIYLAGLRIAHTLTRFVYKQPSTDPLQTLRQAIVSIVGDFTRFVSLKPRLSEPRPAPVEPPVSPTPDEPGSQSPQPIEPPVEPGPSQVVFIRSLSN